jgi:hypothetical protein
MTRLRHILAGSKGLEIDSDSKSLGRSKATDSAVEADNEGSSQRSSIEGIHGFVLKRILQSLPEKYADRALRSQTKSRTV